MASAAVEMLTLDPCRKIMVFNADLGLDSDTDTEIMNTVNGIECKRAMSETEEDHDKGHVKKRRKQSKPVRIASSEFHSDAENYLENGIPQNRDSVYNLSSNSILSINIIREEGTRVSSNDKFNDNIKNDKKDCTVSSSNRDETLNGSDDSLVPMNLSNSKCPGNEILPNLIVSCEKADSHLKETSLNMYKPQGCNEVASSSSFYQESHYEECNFEKDTLLINTSNSPLSFPLVKSVHSVYVQNTVRHTASPVRIFNPEAFCELCNKEFCNKYFLKTHKANKHGVYSENPGPNLIDGLPALPFISYYSNVSEILPTNNTMTRTVPRKSQLPGTLAQPNTVYNVQKAHMTQNGNLRAFCNICQREFCNKYFVRRHKAKIHGIIDLNSPDTPPGELQELKNQNYDSKLCGGNHEKSEDHEIYSSIGEQKVLLSNVQVIPFSDSDKPDNGSCENKTIASVSDQPQVTTTQIKEAEIDESTNPGLIRPNLNVSPMSSTSNIYPQDQVGKLTDTNDKIKRHCTPNSGAFCDICCKEYCNKYFLRTHKLKSHGILQPDFDKRDDRYSAMENNLSQCYSQSMPLNLIVGDQNVEKLETNNKDIESVEFLCDVCGQKFKNAFLLKMHASYVHSNEMYEKTVNSDDNVLVLNDNTFKRNHVTKNDLNILTDSTNKMTSDDKYYDFQNSNCTIFKCEICHKEVESTLLETHIENEHGNFFEEPTITTDDHSNSQQFTGVVTIKYDCLSCHKEFSSTNLLNQHIIDCHGTSTEQIQLSNLTSTKTVKKSEELTKNNNLQGSFSVAEMQPTPTSSFCEICKKELCNKYFMKTHMQRMHGISIDNGAHIGGVVCDICNKELCSKYFLRVHKQNSHGIVDEILGLDISRNQSPTSDPSLKPNEQNDLSNRYFSHFTEVCTICSRRFRSLKWLKAHLLNDHGDEGKEKWREFQSHYEVRNLDKYHQEIQRKYDPVDVLAQSNIEINNGGNISVKCHNEGLNQSAPTCPQNGDEETNFKTNVFTTIFNSKTPNAKQYSCSYCPFSTSILAFLFVHERSHINGSNLLLEQKKFRCKICSLTFDNMDTFEKHSITHIVSDVTKVSCNSNEKIPTEPKQEPLNSAVESGIKVVANNLQGESNCFKTCLKSTKEIKLQDTTLMKRNNINVSIEQIQEYCIGQNEQDFLESYDGVIGEDSKNEHDSYEKYKHVTEANEMNGALTQVKQSLDFIANRTDVPISFSVPQTQKDVIMQPFVLEDSGQHSVTNLKKTVIKKSFLSSIVFLPVKERLTDPVTVSFKLTPT